MDQEVAKATHSTGPLSHSCQANLGSRKLSTNVLP